MHSTLGNCPGGEGLDSKLLNFFSSCASFGPNTLSDKLIFLALLFRGSGLLKFGEPFSIDSKSALILIDGSDYFAAPGQILVQRAIYLVGRGEGGKWSFDIRRQDPWSYFWGRLIRIVSTFPNKEQSREVRIKPSRLVYSNYLPAGESVNKNKNIFDSKKWRKSAFKRDTGLSRRYWVFKSHWTQH